MINKSASRPSRRKGFSRSKTSPGSSSCEVDVYAISPFRHGPTGLCFRVWLGLTLHRTTLLVCTIFVLRNCFDLEWSLCTMCPAQSTQLRELLSQGLCTSLPTTTANIWQKKRMLTSYTAYIKEYTTYRHAGILLAILNRKKISHSQAAKL